MVISLHIPNMNCGGCAKGVAAAIRDLDAAAKVEADLPSRTVAVETTAAEPALRKALEEAGFAPA